MLEAIQGGSSLIGRMLFSVIFLVSAYWQITDFPKWVGRMRDKGMPAPRLLLPVGVLLGVGGALSILLGYWTRLGALATIAFMIPSTLAFHPFWAHAGPEREMETIHFLKNLALLGGALAFLTFGSGPLSLDAGFP